MWRHLPLTDVHPHAQIAAEAAEAAAAQGAFWGMHDELIAHQGDLTARDLTRYAEVLGLDTAGFSDELRTAKYAQRVAEDVATADASGVPATPSFFVNGKRHHGAYDVVSLSSAVRAARSTRRRRARAKSRAASLTRHLISRVRAQRAPERAPARLRLNEGTGRWNSPVSSERTRAPTLRRRDHAAAEIE